MNEERDLLVFTNDEGEEITLEILEYFEYEDEEYALLIDAEDCDDGCCSDSECDCHGEEMEVIVMKVVVDGDIEEFIPVDEDKLDDIVEFLQESLDDDDYDDEDDEE